MPGLCVTLRVDAAVPTVLKTVIVIFESGIMPRGVGVDERVVADVCVSVQVLGISRLRDDGVGLDEAAQRRSLILTAPSARQTVGRGAS